MSDIEKVADLIVSLNQLKLKYEFKDKKNQILYKSVCTLLNKIIKYIEDKY